MQINHAVHSRTRTLRRLLEFALAIFVASMLFLLARVYYVKPIGYTKQSLADHYAGFFSRMIFTINASSIASRQTSVKVGDETHVYVNENGWPANTDKNLSPSLSNQTAAECQQLWRAIFDNAPESALPDSLYNKNAEYTISLNKKSICRYERLVNKEGSYFIDYDVTNGVVTTTARDN